MKYIIAHDLGTSSVKSAIFTTEGELVRSCSPDYETIYTNGGTCEEQNPEDWWKAFCQNNKTLLEGLDPADVEVVSFDGTYPNCICVDKDLKPLYKALIWQDNRAAAEAGEISDKLSPEYATQHPNGRLTVDRTLPKLLWLRKHKPEVYENIYKVLPCASQYIILKLTKKAVADYRTGFSTACENLERNAWSDYMIELAGIPKDILPELHARTDVIGEVGADLSEECGLAVGTKLVLGTGDSDSGDVGMGMLHEGDCYMNGSTSATFVVVNPKVKGLWPPPTSCSGGSIKWMIRTLCTEEQKLAEEKGCDVYDIVNERIAEAPVGSHGVMFHPYLAGERGTLNNPDAKASFTGLSLEATHSDMLRAVYEGIGMNLYNVLQMARDEGYKFSSMPMIGGMAKSPVLRQIFADIMGVEFYTVKHIDMVTAFGVAVLGGIGVGIYKDETAQEKFIHIVDRTKPNMENHEKYKKIIPLFNKVYGAQAPLYKEM
ncbi:MAG: hypothetical protein LIO86_01880 [Lachnospiraceae bacterium]|nr:hypothetical protein [Lachnospiraceae bacterium]